MAVFTDLTLKECEEVTRLFGLSSPLTLTPTIEGVDNSNYFLTTKEGAFVLTLYEGDNQELLQQKLEKTIPFLSHLKKEGCHTPNVLELSQNNKAFSASLFTLKGKNALIQQRISGHSVKGNPTLEQVHIASETLAKIHLASMHYEHGLSAKKLQHTSYTQNIKFLFADWHGKLSQIQSKIPNLSSNAPQHLYAEILKILMHECTYLEERSDILLNDEIPKAYIHGDFFKDNSLFDAEKNEIHLIDFSLAYFDTLLFDLCVFLNAWCFTDEGLFLDLHFKKALDIYTQHRPLTDAEKHAFPSELRRAALRFTLSRLHGNVVTGRNIEVMKNKPPQHWLNRLKHHQQKESSDYGL